MVFDASKEHRLGTPALVMRLYDTLSEMSVELTVSASLIHAKPVGPSSLPAVPSAQKRHSQPVMSIIASEGVASYLPCLAVSVLSCNAADLRSKLLLLLDMPQLHNEKK